MKSRYILIESTLRSNEEPDCSRQGISLKRDVSSISPIPIVIGSYWDSYVDITNYYFIVFYNDLFANNYIELTLNYIGYAKDNFITNSLPNLEIGHYGHP
jgi:hypothetical protein